MKPSNLMTPPKKKPKRHKYNAKPVRIDGIYFPSQHEAKWYHRLKILVEIGTVKRFHRQVIFDLYGVTAKIDFQVIFPDDHIEYWDAKGEITQAYVRNKKQIKELYGVDVKEV